MHLGHRLPWWSRACRRRHSWFQPKTTAWIARGESTWLKCYSLQVPRTRQTLESCALSISFHASSMYVLCRFMRVVLPPGEWKYTVVFVDYVFLFARGQHLITCPSSMMSMVGIAVLTLLSSVCFQCDALVTLVCLMLKFSSHIILKI